MKIFKCCLMVFSIIFYIQPAAQVNMLEPKSDIFIDGTEINNYNNEIVEINSHSSFLPVYGDHFVYTINNITNRVTGYDYQSNASTQQVWYDLNNDYLHAIFMNSQEASTWSDRVCLYFGSTDDGSNWFELGPVPPIPRSGFVAMHGNSIGSAVVSNHNNFFDPTTRATIFIDNSPYEYNFTGYDPGSLNEGAPIWTRHTVRNDKVIFAAAQNGPDSFFVNVLDPSIPSFLGYYGIDGEQAEQYAFAVSDGGKIGLAYNGQLPSADGDVFYIESSDGGITWSPALKIFDRPDFQDTSMGAIRGISCNFFGEQPCVVFEICTQIFSAGNFFPNLPNEIHYWSPAVNGGNSKVIVDSSIVPFAPSRGTNDVQVPYCRPVIGRSETGGFLFVAFDVATDMLYPSADSTTYFAGYFMLSSDGGNTWSVPEKFTPDQPLRDWRYISIAPINPVNGNIFTVHMVMQGDSLPGSNINASGMPVGVTAQYYHVTTELIVVPVELFSFNAKLSPPNIVLNWQTATEANNFGFEIHRKINLENAEGNWITIGFKEGNGTTTETKTYSFYDDISLINAPSFTYRLKQIDYNGNYEYSEEISVENILLPGSFELMQNYPNPFNPTTMIKYSIPQQSFVSIKVYDVLGNEIRTIVNEEKEAGNYELLFDAEKLTSGFYIYQLTAGSFVGTKKMILIR